jgi:glycosyltransferase involved in cell wall biosynthesis
MLRTHYRDLTVAARAAEHAICVSKATEADFLERHPHLRGRTSVIYHGSSFPVVNSPAGSEIFEKPTFLFVGRRATYKNFLFLLRAFAKAVVPIRTFNFVPPVPR